jgi:hypothetical protein|tara:strand:- start:115 stop:420 length:306 start_codon:yes stop_codon:yes gene_type:complete
MGAIIDTLDEYQFVERLMKIRPENFSPKAARNLFYWYEDLSEGIGENIEFDPISICIEWSEYENHKEALEQMGLESIDELYERTVVLPVEEGTEKILVQEY